MLKVPPECARNQYPDDVIFAVSPTIAGLNGDDLPGNKRCSPELDSSRIREDTSQM